MNQRYPRLRVLAESGYTLARDALQLCFYIRRPYQDIAEEVLRALELYQDAVEPQALSLYGSPDGEWQDLDAHGWKRTRDKLLEHQGGITQLRDASHENRYAFDSFGKPINADTFGNRPGAVCAVRFGLPTEYLEEHGPERVRALALRLASTLPFCSGQAGLAVQGDLDLIGVMQRVAPYCFRHPGVDLLPLEHVSWEIGTRVRGPSWLTFLGQPALDGLGGVAGLRNQLRSPGTTVEQLGEGRAVITLGTWPEAGDTEQGHTLPAYRELARVLEPWRFHEEHPYSLGLTPEQLNQWERRFLD
jgi:hypothetical protein